MRFRPRKPGGMERFPREWGPHGLDDPPPSPACPLALPCDVGQRGEGAQGSEGRTGARGNARAAFLERPVAAAATVYHVSTGERATRTHAR